MNNMRLIFTRVTVFAASNALAIGNNYINPGKGICNLDPLPFVDENGNPAFGQFRSESGRCEGSRSNLGEKRSLHPHFDKPEERKPVVLVEEKKKLEDLLTATKKA